MHGPHLHDHEFDCSHTKTNNKLKNLLATTVLILMIAYAGFSFTPWFYEKNDFVVSEVEEIVSEDIANNGLFTEGTQELKVNGLNQIVKYVVTGEGSEKQFFEVGDKLIYSFADQKDLSSVFVVDHYRLPYLLIVFGLFAAVAMFFSGRGAIYSFLALGFSVLILVKVVIGMILNGYNPFLVTMLGAVLISVVSVYLGHGVRRQTNIAIMGILLTLGISTLLATVFVKMSNLFGLGSEEAFFLQIDSGATLNLQGLFLAGIIIGTLGVLDDITTSQVAVVNELKLANPKLNSKELYKRALRVGKEHISALINTLVLAYAGASLPLFILFVTEQIQPVWVILNSEFIAEEIMRTIVGSIALVLSVPITTWLAARKMKN